MSESAIDSAPIDVRCGMCGVVLTAGEVEAARAAELPPLCTTHLAERAPVDVTSDEDVPPPAA
jgi:hypothetical protein